MSFVKKPTRNLPLFDYRRPCDRCGSPQGDLNVPYYRSKLSTEEVTGLIVCDYCKDHWPEQLRPDKRIPPAENFFIID